MNKVPILILVFLAIIFFLVSCGGGGSSSSGTPQPTPAPTHEIRYGYYMGVPGDLLDYYKNVDYVFTPDWGDWNTAQDWLTQQALTELQHAKELGIPHAIMSIGFLVYTKNYAFKGDQGLENLKIQLEALDLNDLVDTFYVIDEPDLAMKHGLTLTAFKNGLDAIKKIFPDKKLMVIYSRSGSTPGIEYFDYVGRDEYDKGAGALDDLPNISENQSLVLVPGGANPYRNDPKPFAAFAGAHPQVSYVVAFLYSDYPEGKGIGSNGMLDQYNKAFGRKG